MENETNPPAPSSVIVDMIIERGISYAQFRDNMGPLEEFIDQLLDGRQPITPSIAERLEVVLGQPKEYWVKLEKEYSENPPRYNLYEVLTDMLEENYMYWSGEYRIKSVRLSDEQLAGWQYVPGGGYLIWQQLCRIETPHGSEGWYGLWGQLRGWATLAFQRASDEQGIYELVIVSKR
jgi:plasmid maintenance system antidote protein VapI